MKTEVTLGVVMIFVRILIIIPAMAVMFGALGDINILWRQPSFYIYCYGSSVILAIICFVPYFKLFFVKNVKLILFLILLLLAMTNIWRILLPSYYVSSQLKNYPIKEEAYKQAIQDSKTNLFFLYQEDRDDNGMVLWWVQKPNYHEWPLLGIYTVFSLGPLLLFFIRSYQLRKLGSTHQS
jgi:hypothetical protein